MFGRFGRSTYWDDYRPIKVNIQLNSSFQTTLILKMWRTLNFQSGTHTPWIKLDILQLHIWLRDFETNDHIRNQADLRRCTTRAVRCLLGLVVSINPPNDQIYWYTVYKHIHYERTVWSWSQLQWHCALYIDLVNIKESFLEGIHSWCPQ